MTCDKEDNDGLTISNWLLRRVLVDGGSSPNILLKKALEGTSLDDRDITKKSTPLVDYSGEAQQTVREITMPTFSKGVNLQTRFNVVDYSSAYNIILGTQWIHKMKAVMSTYQQTLRFRTKWGVQEIKGEQITARECYSSSLKPAKASI